jgi:excisionase family DNA binding protein
LEDLLTADEISKMLKVSKIAVYQWARRGLLPHYKIEKCIRFAREDIQVFLRKRRVESTPSS